MNVNGGGLGTRLIFSLSHIMVFVPLVLEQGRRREDRVPSVEPFQKQAGGGHFRGSGQDPYKAWLQGAVLGGSVWDNCLPRGRYCRTRSALVYKNVAMKLQPSRLLSPCVCKECCTLPPPRLLIFFTISVHNSITASLVHPSPVHLITIHYILLHLITSSLITTSPITTRTVTSSQYHDFDDIAILLCVICESIQDSMC